MIPVHGLFAIVNHFLSYTIAAHPIVPIHRSLVADQKTFARSCVIR
jgi:hypothetical protein